MSGHVGSTAVLPCKLQSVDTETPYIRWRIDTETVFERLGKETYQDEGYEGRVDVPEEELRKGNCSLVLKHLKLTDTADYMSYEVVRGTRGSNRFKRSETAELNLISKVHLSVIGECVIVSRTHTDHYTHQKTNLEIKNDWKILLFNKK